MYEILALDGKTLLSSELLYAPPKVDFPCRSSRVYFFDFEGSEKRAEELVRTTLLDPITQELHIGGEPALSGQVWHLDYGMKRTALDLEKEAILANWGPRSGDDFTIENLVIRQRLYLHSAEGASPDPEDYLRDIVNPAIHSWEVTHA